MQIKSGSIKSLAFIPLLLLFAYFAPLPTQSFAIDSDAAAESPGVRDGFVCNENGDLKYYSPETGAMATSCWYFDNSTGWYYFEYDGAAATGWRYLAGDWYYFDSQHVMASGRVRLMDNGIFWVLLAVVMMGKCNIVDGFMIRSQILGAMLLPLVASLSAGR